MYGEGDEISSGEGQQAPNELNPVRPRRIRKLSGPERVAIGELAFLLYSACESLPHLRPLRDALATWRAKFL